MGQDSSTNYLDWLTDLLSMIITGFIRRILQHEPCKLCWIFRHYKHCRSTCCCMFVSGWDYLCRVHSYTRHCIFSKFFCSLLFPFFFSFSSFFSFRMCASLCVCVCWRGFFVFRWIACFLINKATHKHSLLVFQNQDIKTFKKLKFPQTSFLLLVWRVAS